MNVLPSFAPIPRPPLAAWAFDALEAVAHECGGVGDSRFEPRRCGRANVVLPFCITSMATAAALRMGLRYDAIILALTQSGISPFVSDVAVAAICIARGQPHTARVSWVEYIAEVGLVRDESIEAPSLAFFASLTAWPPRRAEVH